MHWSAAAEAVFGYSATNAVGQLLAELVVPLEQRELEAQKLAATLQTGLETYETAHRRRDGSARLLDVSDKAIAAGETDVVLRSYKDVTDLKLAA